MILCLRQLGCVKNECKKNKEIENAAEQYGKEIKIKLRQSRKDKTIGHKKAINAVMVKKDKK